ncbi:glycoside hydrolase family 17 protein, partial [Cercospora zeae-maydis SCOH1-5]
SGGIHPNGNQWAMTYTPYRADGGCKSGDEVNSDISNIKSKGFNTVRIYATDCNGPENVGAACKANGMSMIVGIFIDSKGLGAAHEQAQDLMTWGKTNDCWSMVSMIVAGNEAIFSGAVSAQDMASFITEIKPQFKAAGYNGPVTTTEPLNIMQANAATLCPVIDVVGGNLHPFFNGQYAADQAGDLVAQQLKDLAACCGGLKDAYNLETGWPSQGQANGAAVPGENEQRQAIESIMNKVGAKSVFLSYADDTWKAPGEYGIEQHWGCAN